MTDFLQSREEGGGGMFVTLYFTIVSFPIALYEGAAGAGLPGG